MDSLEETTGIEEDDDSPMDHLIEEVRRYNAIYGKAWRVHVLGSKRNINVNTPKIGPEAKPLIPAPITEEDDFEKLVKEYDAELRIYARRFVYRSREPGEVAADIVQRSWMDAYRFMKSQRWHPISAAVFGHLDQIPLQGYTNVEIAKELSCSPNTVRSHVLRGRQYLHKMSVTKKNMRKRKKSTS